MDATIDFYVRGGLRWPRTSAVLSERPFGAWACVETRSSSEFVPRPIWGWTWRPVLAGVSQCLTTPPGLKARHEPGSFLTPDLGE
jgi:hypothetical protein